MMMMLLVIVGGWGRFCCRFLLLSWMRSGRALALLELHLHVGKTIEIKERGEEAAGVGTEDAHVDAAYRNHAVDDHE
nr:uncharacterized protein LOC112275937 isoform X4 [Physcomitrium patens]|eukprot:XP_024362508.1 uncharacterized protein LOC112275937 isoform X4 [Physcomitrella patens]